MSLKTKLLSSIILLFLVSASVTYGQVIVTAGTGGTNLVKSTAVNGSSPAYTTLGDIVITETKKSDIKEGQKNKKLILTAPPNWQFNPSSGSIATTLGDDIKKISLKVHASKIEIKFTTDKKKKGKNSIDEITLSGIQVQPIDGNITPAAGNIIRKAKDRGNAKIKGITEEITSFASLSTDPESSMPVELTSFTADVFGGGILLNWSTATEVNNYGFEVQRSAAYDEWEVIGFVEGHGNSNSPKEYEFADDLTTLEDYQENMDLEYRLKQIDTDGAYEYYSLIAAVASGNITGIEDESMPVKFELLQNYPNPFNPATTIKFSLPESAETLLEVYNSIGQKVATLIDQDLGSGYHEVEWNASGFATGLYIYRLTSQNFVAVKKMVLLK
jgi:hypothetical protein